MSIGEQNTEADALANEAMDETARGGSASTSAAKPEVRAGDALPRKFRATYRDGALHFARSARSSRWNRSRNPNP